MKALLVIDVQNDFCPGGALPVEEGDRVVPEINRVMDDFPLVVASQDWHPPKTRHFERWPPHCIRETEGAALHPDLRREPISLIVRTGTGELDDGYSAFEATNVNLEQFLKENDVDELYIAGLATDFCVRCSALDAARAGFNVRVIENAIAAIGDPEPAMREMKEAGIKFVRL